MEGGLRKFAKQAAEAEREAQGLALPPDQNYRGVKKHYKKYGAEIWDPSDSWREWLGSYDTPEEAASEYDAAARTLQGHRAKPNLRELTWAPGEEDVRAAAVLAHFAEVRRGRAEKMHGRAEKQPKRAKKMRGSAVRVQAAAEAAVVAACHANSPVPP